MRIFDLPDDTPLTGPEFSIGPDNKFICKPTLPAGAMVNLFYATQAVDQARRAAGLVGVIRAAINADDQERFTELVWGDAVNVPLGVLEEIATWLVEEYTGRPTTPSSGSPAGSTPTPDTPVDGSSVTVSE